MLPTDQNDSPFDVSACLKRVRANDQQAARELVEHLNPLVTKIVLARKSWKMSAEDLIQEVFLKMFTRLNQYQGNVPFRHWVSRIAVTTCIDNLRFHRRRPEYRWADLSEAEMESLDTILKSQKETPVNDALSAGELVHKLLAELKKEDEMVLRLLDLEQKTIAEISTITGWNQSLVKIRAFRARKKLHKLFLELKDKEFAG